MKILLFQLERTVLLKLNVIPGRVTVIYDDDQYLSRY